jgi:hypothetical protein
MNILDAIINAKEGAAVQQLGSQFGLGQDQTTAALSALIPALAAGFQKNLQSPEGAGNLMSALSQGNHQRYIDNPQSLGDQNAVAEGNGILGHVLGSKDVSRQVASRAAAQTGISPDLLKQMLPLAATLVMGAFSQKSGPASGGLGSMAGMPGLSGSGGGIMDMLTPLLDRNRDGSIIDDVTSMIGRFGKP